MEPEWGSRAWLEAHFDTPEGEGDAWGNGWRGSQRLRHHLTLELLRPLIASGGRDVLDVGCGLGEFTAALAAVHPGNRVTGVDMCERAVSRAREANPGLSFRTGTLPDLALPDAAYDLITALEMLYYLDDAGRAAAPRELRRLLRPGGHLVFSSTLADPRRYFSERSAVHLLESAFEVREVGFLHGRLYGAVERRPLELWRRLKPLSESERLDRFLARYGRRLIREGLGAEVPARLLERLARRLPGRRFASNVLIVARKEERDVTPTRWSAWAGTEAQPARR